MRRALALALVFLAALVAVAPSAGATAPQHALLFELHSDGFLIQGRSQLGSDRLRLLLDRRGEVAYYNAKARLGAGTVRARFGRLGSLDLAFAPGKREAPLGCGGEYGWQQGNFTGSLVFHGEHHYADVDASRAHGWFETHPVRHCARSGSAGGSGSARRAPATPATELGLPAATTGAAAATASRAAAVAETGVRLEAWTSYQLPYAYFGAFTESGKSGVQVGYTALLAEHREGMQIDRGAQLYGGARTFEWDLVAGTARVEPPAPFSGRASFRREPGGRSRLWGSLSAPILGGRPLRLTGGDFDTFFGPGT